MQTPPPQVSVVLPVRDGERYLTLAVASILRQTLADLELIVVDDCSQDATAAVLAGFDDPRLTVLTNDEPLGLAASLNRGIRSSRARYVARIDADDIALRGRLARQLAELRARPRLAVLGSSVVALDAANGLGSVHLLPRGPLVTRWRCLFGTPFYHPSVLLDRQALERHDLWYDERYEAGEPEDYELWTRLLAVGDGDNVTRPLLLYRVHPAQASERRAADQLALRERLAVTQIRELAPELDGESARLAWRVGDGRSLPAGQVSRSVATFLALLERFEQRQEPLPAERRLLRAEAARSVARASRSAGASERPQVLRRAASLDPRLLLSATERRLCARRWARAAESELEQLLQAPAPSGGAEPLRVAVVSPEPAPYRAPIFDRLGRREELDLTVIYSARTIAGRTWDVDLQHRAVFLHGIRIPGMRRFLDHEYPLTTGVVGALRAARPDVVVVSGWSTFASQAAAAWCRLHGVPYVLFAESHDEGPRAPWRRAVKGAVVPRIVRGSASVLVNGSLTRESMLRRGARADGLRLFANTIDVEAYAERAEELAPRRDELRRGLGVAEDDVLVLSVARLAPEKGLDTLLQAVAAADDPRLALVVIGEGEERARLELLGRRLGLRLALPGDRPGSKLLEAYVAADVFALLSTREPWGVVVNEAAACGLPLLLSERVGAAPDLLREGENGRLVPAGDVEAAAAALRELAADPEARRRMGTRSRELIAGWGYDASIESFVAAVQGAARVRA